jgi:hypothetical protein
MNYNSGLWEVIFVDRGTPTLSKHIFQMCFLLFAHHIVSSVHLLLIQICCCYI